MAKRPTTIGVEKKQKYSALDDTRRFSDGVRMHEYLAYILMAGGDDLLSRYPNHHISRAEFSKAACRCCRGSDLRS
jgi:hypothetical protein